MTQLTAFKAARVFDGAAFHDSAAVLVRDGRVEGIARLADIPAAAVRVDTGAALLCPGFVDWQVNGGGGVLFNTAPTSKAAGQIARAHLAFGTTALLPTVITDAPHVTDAAAEAIVAALQDQLPGIVGIHFEGPHLSLEKRGVHEPGFIRPLEQRDFKRLTQRGLGAVVATVAPENATMEDMTALSEAGVLVSIGHTNAGYETGRKAFAAGARAVTHLFNAMAPLHHRNPGLVGAALEDPEIYCGLIADGYHVHEAVLRMVFAAGPSARLTLVTDAMSSVGHPDDSFELNGRTVRRQNGRLTVADGTLAGSDLDMLSALRFSVLQCGVGLGTALQMASRNPARMLGLADRGHFAAGARADIVSLTDGLEIVAVRLGGESV